MPENTLPDVYFTSYDFLDNGANELMLVTESLTGAIEFPVFYFDGQQGQALLRRRADQFVALTFIDEDVRRLLASVKSILIAEMESDDDIGAVYPVDVEQTPAGLPYPAEYNAMEPQDE